MVFYGTLQQQISGTGVISEEEMRRLEEERKAGELKAKRLSEELEITIARLKRGEITSISQIPEEQRKYLDIPEGFFGRVEEYQRQKTAYESAIAEREEWALARKLIYEGKAWVAQDVPSLREKIKQLREEGFRSYHEISAIKPSTTIFIEGLGYTVAPKYQEEFLKQMQVSTPTQPQIQQLGGMFFKPSEAEAIGITPTAAQLEKGFLFVPEKEIVKPPPLFRYAPEKTRAYIKSFAEPPTFTAEELERFELETPYGELLKRGMVSSIIRKGFYEAGEEYFKVIGKGMEEMGAKPLTEKQIEKGGVIIGRVGLGVFFAPVMKTGTLQEELAKADLGKTRYEGLKQIAKPTTYEKYLRLAKIEKKLIMKTPKEQLKYLKEIKLKLKTPEEIKGFEVFVRELIKKEVIKLPTYQVKVPLVSYEIAKIPEMKEIGVLVGGVPALEKFLKEPKIEIRPEEKVKVVSVQRAKQIPATITIPKLKAPQLTKQIPKTKQIPRFKYPFPEISMKPAKPTRGLPPPAFLLPRRKLEPRKIIRVKRIIPRERYRPSLVALGLGIKAPRIPRAYIKGFGALIVRPIITKRKRRKKK